MRGLFLILFSLISIFVSAQGDFEFVPNKGQFHENALYRANVPSGALFLEKDGLTFSFYDGAFFHNIHHGESVDSIHFHAYKISFKGGKKPTTFLNNENDGVLNYYLGNDQSKWVTGVKGGSEIYYKNIYKNIDFKLYTKNGKLKYDFIVHPGGKVKDIQLEFTGLNDLFLRDEELFMTTSLGIVKDSKPVANQIEKSIPVNFLLNNDILSFEVGSYNNKEDLIIDPTLVFSTYSGSFANNFGFTATYDNAGNLYAGGSVFSEGYPTTLGAYDLTFSSNAYWGFDAGVVWGISDIGITKYSGDGTSRLYSTYIGGNRCEVPHSLIVNNRNELFVLGTTSSSNYPVTMDAFDPTFNGGDTTNLANGIFINYTHGSDIVVSRLSADGSSMLASTYVGGTENDGLNLNVDLVANYADQMRGEIILDEFQNVVIGSSTASSDFPTTLGAYQNIYGGGEQDGVVFKMDENLSGIIWSSYIGGSDADGVYSIIQSNSNDVYVAGGTKSQNLSFPSGAYQSSYQGGITDGFYVKLSGSGTSILNGSYFGSDKYDQIYFIREDKFDQIYTYGQSEKYGTYWIQNASYNKPNSGQFISKFKPSQTALEWSTTFGSGDSKINISPTAFLVDLCNKVYLSGWGSDKGGFDHIGGNIANGTIGMEVTPDAFKSNTLGHDFYLMVLEDDASSLVYGSFYGGDLSEEHVDGGTSRFDEKGVMYQSVCAGCGGNNDFPIEPSNAVSTTNNGQFYSSPGCNNGVFKFDFGLPTIVADFANTPVVCSPGIINFSDKSKTLDATTYLWDFGDGSLSTDTNPIHNFTAPGHYDVKLKITDPAACNVYDSITKTVIIIGGVLSDLGNDSSCTGQLAQIGISPYPDTSVTYAWFPTIGLSDSTISNPLVNVEAEKQYTLIISKNGCADTLKQTVFPFLFDYEIEDGVGCEGEGFGAVFEGDGNFEKYFWSSNKFFSDTLNDFPFDNNLVDSPLVKGVNMYYIRAYDNNGCEVQDSLIIWGAGGFYENTTDSICFGDTVVFSDTSLNSLVVGYNWQPSDSIYQKLQDSIIVIPNVTQIYSLYKNFGLRCFDTLIFPVEVVNNQPIEMLDIVVCNEYTIEVTADTNNIYVPIYWSSNNLLTDTLNASRTFAFQPNIGLDTLYIEYTDTFGCKYTKDFKIENLNFKVKTTSDSIACNKVFPTIEITNFDAGSMVDLHWESTSKFTTDSTLPITSIEAADFYNRAWISVSDTNGCFDSDTVIILNLAIEDYKLPDTSICEGDYLKIGIPVDSTSNGLFNWIPSGLVSNDTIANPVVLGNDTMQYGLIIDNGSCRDTIYQTVNISNVSLEAFGDTSFCNELPIIKVANFTKLGLTHLWSIDRNFTDTISSGVDLSEIDIQAEIGDQTIYVKVYDSIGCKAIDSVFMQVNEYDLTFENNLESCLGKYIGVVPNGYENYDSVQFIWGPSPILITPVNDTNALLIGPSGSYVIPVTSTSAYGCTDTDYVNITIASFDTNSVGLITSMDTLINNETAVLTATPSGLSYLWEPNEAVISQNGNQATVKISEETTFTVEISDPVVSKCFRKDSVSIFFIDSKCEDPYIYVPNAFTPNGDGENDVLFVRGRNITDLYFAVFNRWGEKVFETNNQSNGWDGSFRNRSSDPAVFDFYIKYKCGAGIEYFQKGNITLIR